MWSDGSPMSVRSKGEAVSYLEQIDQILSWKETANYLWKTYQGLWRWKVLSTCWCHIFAFCPQNIPQIDFQQILQPRQIVGCILLEGRSRLSRKICIKWTQSLNVFKRHCSVKVRPSRSIKRSVINNGKLNGQQSQEETRVIHPGEKALMVDRFNTKNGNVPYISHKLEKFEPVSFHISQPPVVRGGGRGRRGLGSGRGAG